MRMTNECKYCGDAVDNTYWKTLCQDCANKMSRYKRMKKEEKLHLVLECMDGLKLSNREIAILISSLDNDISDDDNAINKAKTELAIKLSKELHSRGHSTLVSRSYDEVH